MIGIYKIINNINGKVYIGQSVNIKKRWSAHVTNLNKEEYKTRPLYRSFRKHGLQNFSFEILENCLEEILNEREIFWIDKYQSCLPDKGYNLDSGGGQGIFNRILSDVEVDEIIKLLSETKEPQKEIGERYYVSHSTISRINTGVGYFREDLIYPIRMESIKPKPMQNYCLDCNCPIDKRASRCNKCAHILQQKANRPSRNELKDLIRSTPFATIGLSYGVSDNAIRKWCISENLPSKAREIKKISDKDWINI